MTEDNQLTRQSIPKLVRQIAIPASVGYFFHTMYNVVDTYFGGLISTQALASLSLSLPVFFIIIAVGTGISTGATALIGNALGAGKKEEAKLFALQAVSFGVLTSIALSFFGVYASPFLFRILGASDGYLVMAVTYMSTIFLGTMFFMLVYMLNAILNALGETRPFRDFLIVGFLLNIVLDPWFIYGGLGVPAMGIVGIALATVLIQIVGCVYLGFRVYKTGLIADKRVKDIFPRVGSFKEIARQGFPASVNMMTVGMGIFVITYFVSHFGKEAVAAYGIAMRVEQIVLIPTIGLNIATLTLVAQNNGAKLFNRVKESLSTALRYGGILMAFGTIGVFVLAKPLMAFFTDDWSVIAIGTTYLRIDALVLYAYVILFVNVAVMQGIKKPMYAVWIGMYRQLVAPFIVFWVLTRSLDSGVLGIWWGIFSITWSAAIFTIFYVRRRLKEAMHPTPVSP
ncbi:MAG: MATE family efflux transporter [Desulfobacteraceae bacterium]|jgi:putative MATE family efflux protein